MGEALYGRLIETVPGAACRTYAPVGGHRDLLAYLVRRLLENGANSSFVSVAADPDVPVADPAAAPGRDRRHARGAPGIRALPLPRDLFAPERRNSRGVEFGHRAALEALLAEVEPRDAGRGTAAARSSTAKPGRARRGDVLEPDRRRGRRPRRRGDRRDRGRGPIAAARRGFRGLGRDAGRERARRRSSAPPTSSRRGAGGFIHLLQVEGGKTLDDALSEVREAVDFCRYYAAQGRRLFGEGERCPGRPASRTCCACADAASSSRSRPGTFRSRSSSARSRRR